MAFDPILFEIVRSRLSEAAATMEHRLFHSGYSPILRESADGSAAILDRDGQVVIGAGFPIHLFPYYYIGRTTIELKGDQLKPGQSYLLNDPYLSGNFHVPDTAIISPYFFEGELVAFCASIAHKPDLGGSVPGSSSSSAREIFEEGIVFPGVLYCDAEGPRPDIAAIISRNSRAPGEVIGDLNAQVGCTRVGMERLDELFALYGAELVLGAFDAIIERSRALLADGISKWPDGEASAEAFLEHREAPSGRARLHVKVTKRADRLKFDYSGSDPQIAAPINIRPQAAETAAVLATIPFLDPAIPINDGCRRPIDFVNPPGLVTNAARPMPINNYYGTMHLLYCCVQSALSQFAPEAAVACAGLGWGGWSVGYADNSVQYEVIPPSLGGTANGDGAFQVQPMSHITPSQPIEILEMEYPVEVIRFEPMVDSAGAGRFRGGSGYVRAYRFHADAHFNLKMMAYSQGAWGIRGGGASNPHRFVLNPGRETEQLLPSWASMHVQPGDEIWMELPGGGGYGYPKDRARDLVELDVRDGMISRPTALETYGAEVD